MLTAKLKSKYIEAICNIAFLPPFRGALYTRTVARWPYQHTLAQMNTLSRLLLSVKVPGIYLEVGCADGSTTIWQAHAMKEAGVARVMHVVDTFSGFTSQDKAVEESERGKQHGTYDNYFIINRQSWFDESMRRAGIFVISHESDSVQFDYSTLPRIAFAFVDVDLYRPVLQTLPLIFSRMTPGGMIVVDDCDPTNATWDGAHQAYLEFCGARNIEPDILDTKLGIIRP
jgi:hypothetical protein